jgi:hypothetical protein
MECCVAWVFGYCDAVTFRCFIAELNILGSVYFVLMIGVHLSKCCLKAVMSSGKKRVAVIE